MKPVFITIVDLTAITDYWNWVRSMESSNEKGNRIVIGESTLYPKSILADPEKYFTPEVMQALDEAAKKEFRYGN